MLGERLTLLRKNKKMTQQKVADKLHLSRGTYAQYEIDRRVPEYATLQSLADFYEVSIDYLVGRTENPNQFLSEPSRALIDYIDNDLTDEEIIARMDIKVDGVGLDDDSIKLFVALIRAQRVTKEQSAAFQAGGSKNL